MKQVKTYRTHGVCARSISFTISEKGTVHDVHFEGGCHGNGQGISRLAEGRQAAEIVKRLDGIHCEEKKTSCPDQLARALKACIASETTRDDPSPLYATEERIDSVPPAVKQHTRKKSPH